MFRELFAFRSGVQVRWIPVSTAPARGSYYLASNYAGGDVHNVRKRAERDKVRYAVVGLGYISQIAVLPAFGHARENSRLTALVSGDLKKLKTLSQEYCVDHTYTYEQYSDCLRSGDIDAVYIALPNHIHHIYANAAAEAGVHVLCEKPMAFSEAECESM